MPYNKVNIFIELFDVGILLAVRSWAMFNSLKKCGDKMRVPNRIIWGWVESNARPVFNWGCADIMMSGCVQSDFD